MSVLLLCTMLAFSPAKRPEPNPHDGDTAWVGKCDKRKNPLNLRVGYIDAPEYKAFQWGDQPGRTAARDLAIKTCPPGDPVKVRLLVFDKRSSRWIASFECKGKDLALTLAQAGTVWPYMVGKDKKIMAAVKQAQDQNLGLWKLGGEPPIAPTIWRAKGMHQPAGVVLP